MSTPDALRGLLAAFKMDESYPVTDVLRQLADAADHLLGDHSCDQHGHEGVAIVRDAARKYADDIDAALKNWREREPLRDDQAMRDEVRRARDRGRGTLATLDAIDAALFGPPVPPASDGTVPK